MRNIEPAFNLLWCVRDAAAVPSETLVHVKTNTIVQDEEVHSHAPSCSRTSQAEEGLVVIAGAG